MIEKENSIGFKDFCENTSLHGWGIMSFGGFKVSQILFWLFAIIVSSVGMVIMNAGTIDEYQNDVEYIVESMAESLNQIYFPAIYMFKTAQFRKSVLANWVKLDPIWANHSFNESTKSLVPLFDSYRILESALTGKELCEEDQEKLSTWMKSNYTQEMIKEFLTENMQEKFQNYGTTIFHHHSIQDLENEELVETMNNLKVSNRGYFGKIFGFTQPSDFLVNVVFDGKGVVHFGGNVGCSGHRRNYFLPIFQSATNVRSDLKDFVQPYAESGYDKGITMMIDGEFWDDLTTLDLKTKGILTGLVHPLDTELDIFNGLWANPGELTILRVSTHQIKTRRGIRLDATKRKCYFDDEVVLNHFPKHSFRYSINNCLVEAFYQKTEETCNCSPYGAFYYQDHYDYCNHTGDECRKANNITLGRETTFMSKGERLTCFVNCNDQPFKTSISAVKLDEKISLVQNMTLLKLKKTCNSYKKEMFEVSYPNICNHLEDLMKPEFHQSEGHLELLRYVKENLIGIQVFFDSPYVQVFERKAKMSIPTLLSNIGGMMGLCLGFSLLSVVEIFYFVFLWMKTKINSMTSSTIIKVHPQSN